MIFTDLKVGLSMLPDDIAAKVRKQLDIYPVDASGDLKIAVHHVIPKGTYLNVGYAGSERLLRDGNSVLSQPYLTEEGAKGPLSAFGLTSGIVRMSGRFYSSAALLPTLTHITTRDGYSRYSISGAPQGSQLGAMWCDSLTQAASMSAQVMPCSYAVQAAKATAVDTPGYAADDIPSGMLLEDVVFSGLIVSSPIDSNTPLLGIRVMDSDRYRAEQRCITLTGQPFIPASIIGANEEDAFSYAVRPLCEQNDNEAFLTHFTTHRIPSQVLVSWTGSTNKSRLFVEGLPYAVGMISWGDDRRGLPASRTQEDINSSRWNEAQVPILSSPLNIPFYLEGDRAFSYHKYQLFANVNGDPVFRPVYNNRYTPGQVEILSEAVSVCLSCRHGSGIIVSPCADAQSRRSIKQRMQDYYYDDDPEVHLVFPHRVSQSRVPVVVVDQQKAVTHSTMQTANNMTSELESL